MKIALINNMNNNFFFLARYLRDEGFDAHLFQVDELEEHFQPDCDTFEDITSYNFIHRVSSISFKDFFTLPISPKLRWKLKKLKNELNNFDLVIGCGGLAILEWAGITVDLFIPYGSDLHLSPFLLEVCKKKYFPYPILLNRYSYYQRRAIDKTRAIVAFASMDRHLYDSLMKLNKSCIDWPIPMGYPLLDVAVKEWDFLQEHDFILFSHTKHAWTMNTTVGCKGNDKAIHGFAKFIKQQTTYHHPIMVLFDYGADVMASKKLIADLGIEQYVRWMPKMARKYIYQGLKAASIVFDFFNEQVICFGGVTFEAFACEKAVIGNNKLAKVKNEDIVPITHANSPEEVCSILLDYSKNPTKYIEHGKKVKDWFDAHVGKGLVAKYIQLIEYLANNKSHALDTQLFNLPTIKSYTLSTTPP